MITTQAAIRHPSSRRDLVLATGALLGLMTQFLAPAALAFDSGSSGADGAFAPSVDTRLTLPEDGVFNFTTVDIPAGVTISFNKNTGNTPVVMLATGDVKIAGTIDISGTNATDVGAAGDGHIGDDGLPGLGGPGGYDGGVGGLPEGDFFGGGGLGPGGGGYGTVSTMGYRGNGGGGSFGTNGSAINGSISGQAGETYGSSLLLPLIGGSGGGGGMGGDSFAGSGGGGGGGALLIAASGTMTVSGTIQADGGRAGHSSGSDCGAVGGGGSGGGIRLVATTIAGEGDITAIGAGRPVINDCATSGYIVISGEFMHTGGDGRIRLETETLNRTSGTTPTYTFGSPGSLFIAGLPTLRISRVGGVNAPANPTGVADISLPGDIPNPVTVEFEATGIPLGNIVELTVVPARGSKASSVSNTLDGDTNLSTASAFIDLPQGPSTLMASVTYTLVAGLDGHKEYYERIAGEPVRSLRIEASLNGEPRYLLITESGREIPMAKAVLAAG